MLKFKKVLSWALVVAMTAGISVAGTMAYLTDEDSAVNVMTVGNVQITQKEQERAEENGLQDFTQGQSIVPAADVTGEKKAITVNGYEVNIRTGETYVDKIVSVTNDGVNDAYVRTIFAFPEAGEFNTTTDASEQWLHWNGVSDTDTVPANGWMWGTEDDAGNYIEWPGNAEGWDVVENVEINGKEYDIYVATNKNVIASGESTSPSLMGFFLDTRVDYDGTNYIFTDKDGKEWNLGDISKLDILVLTQAAQTDGFADAWTALDTAFGDVTAENAAEWFGDLEFPVLGTQVYADNIADIDFTAENTKFVFNGEFDAVNISKLGNGSVLALNNATIGDMTLGSDATVTGTGTLNKINTTRNSAEAVTLNIMDATLDIEGELGVRNTDNKSILNIENSNVDFGTIFVGEHTNNHGSALAEFNVINSFLSGEENGLGSTINVWGQSGVSSQIYDSEIYTYSRGWHQSEDANDNAITFQGANSIDVDIQRSNMHLYGARSIIYARKYGNAETTIDFTIDESLIWVVTKSTHGEDTLPVWGTTEITDSILLFTKDRTATPIFKSFVYGNPVIHGEYHVTTQCEWDAPIALADGQTVTFASDANVSIYDGAGNVEFVKTGSAKVVLEDGATVTNIGGLN